MKSGIRNDSGTRTESGAGNETESEIETETTIEMGMEIEIDNEIENRTEIRIKIEFGIKHDVIELGTANVSVSRAGGGAAPGAGARPSRLRYSCAGRAGAAPVAPPQ
ncbi:hypothetical protein EVAR_13420_1 [Eumeta japonica]|uniref:Uncharacterized protein n=1 Tax=Eumeta variegata TaxID=151549 RepID=A0A4C1V650_EUMVA|nr:hypothetical protein EVAR_13420_1 [Eumeta japonica]